MTTTEVARNEQPTIGQLIERMKPEIGRALPRHMHPDRMTRIALTVIRQNDKLAACNPVSLLGALMTASQLGLEPGPTGEAYLVPFGREVTFIPGYRGLIKLARNSGQLVDIWAEIVYENDLFKQTLGLHRDLLHEPADGDRGKPTHVYAAARLKDGGTPFVVMTVTEVEAIRKRSRASGNGPWVTDWNAMAKKTLIKQLAKWLPLSAEFNAAVTLDGAVRTDVGELVDVQPDYVDGEVTDAPAIEPAAVEPTPDSPEVRMATDDQLLDLAQAAEQKFGKGAKAAESWRKWVGDKTGRTVPADSDLTWQEAGDLLALAAETEA